MKRKLVFSIVFLLLLLIALMLNMPAKYALSMVAKHTGLFSFQSATGTLFEGSATAFRVRAKNQVLDLGKLDWQLCAWALLMGNVKIDVENKLSPQDIFIDAKASANWLKTLTLTDAEVRAPLPLLVKFAPMPIKAAGNIELNITELVFTDNKIANLQGQLLLQNMQVTMQQTANLGTFAARLSNEDNTLIADVTDIDADIGVTGQAAFDQSERMFNTDITVTTSTKTPKVVSQSLPFFSRKTNNNTFVIQQSGRL